MAGPIPTFAQAWKTNFPGAPCEPKHACDVCTSARFITRSQRRYETQTRDYSRTPSSTTEYGLFRVSSDLRLGERLPPVAGFPLAWPQLWSPKGWPASVGALGRSLGGSRERPIRLVPDCSRGRTPAPSKLGSPHRGHVSSFNFAGAPDCKQGPAASSPTLQGPGSGHPESGGI